MNEENTEEKHYELNANIKASVLKALVAIASSLVDEMKIHVNGGFSFKIVDPAHVAMIEATFPKKVFQDFDGTDFEVGIDLDKLKEFLKNAKATKSQDDLVHIAYINSGQDKMEYQVGYVRNQYATLDISGMSNPKVPELNLPNRITIDVEILKRYLKNNQQISDNLIMSFDNGVFKIEMEGDIDTSALEIPKAALDYTNVTEFSAVSKFNFDYFKSLIDQVKGQVELIWGQDYPLKMKWHVADDAEIIALLAPRIDTE